MGDHEHARTEAIRAAAGNFSRALGMMRGRDPQAAEDGFALLRDIADQHVLELLDEFRRETVSGMRCWLLEIIGETRSPQAFDVPVGVVRGEEESLHFWARRGLELLGTKEARRLLWQSQINSAGT